MRRMSHSVFFPFSTLSLVSGSCSDWFCVYWQMRGWMVLYGSPGRITWQQQIVYNTTTTTQHNTTQLNRTQRVKIGINKDRVWVKGWTSSVGLCCQMGWTTCGCSKLVRLLSHRSTYTAQYLAHKRCSTTGALLGALYNPPRIKPCRNVSFGRRAELSQSEAPRHLIGWCTLLTRPMEKWIKVQFFKKQARRAMEGWISHYGEHTHTPTHTQRVVVSVRSCSSTVSSTSVCTLCTSRVKCGLTVSVHLNQPQHCRPCAAAKVLCVLRRRVARGSPLLAIWNCPPGVPFGSAYCKRSENKFWNVI